ncbi:MAG: adenylate/guanylate cyclase domain-containing response regulator, partial [Planctomycetota bacterium]
MCTGIMTSSSNLSTAMDAGAVDYIRKPVDQLELLARVSSMLKLRDSYKIIKFEREKSEKLLLNILPSETAEELKEKGRATP